MSVILRVDDFPGTKPEEFWRHNLDNFRLFHTVMEKHNLKYVLGVIPRYVTEEMSDYLDYLVADQKLTIALHGVRHDEQFDNEFRPFETEWEICDKLRLARSRLCRHGTGLGWIDTYIPPHNVIDMKTCNALQRTGFKTILGGPGSDRSVLEYAKTLGIDARYSSPPHWYGRSDEMLERNSPAFISATGKMEPDLCFTLHWTWEMNIGLHNLDALLQRVAIFLRNP